MAKAGPTLSHLTDAEIVKKLKASDQEGMRALLVVHGQTVFNVLAKRHGHHVAADAMNRAAMVIWADMSEKHRDGEGTLLGWFLQIANNKAIDIRRGEKHDKFVELDLDENYDPTKCKDDDYEDEKAETLQRRLQRNEDVKNIIKRLPRKERIVTECDRDSSHDIAEIDVIRKTLDDPLASRGSIETARSRARATIRAEMTRLGHYPLGVGRRKNG